MSTFLYEAMNQAGQEVKDEIDAPSHEEALSKIRALGYFPTKIREKGGKKRIAAAGPKKRKMPFAIGGVPNKKMVQFTRQLSTLQDAGLPILRSLRILEQQQRPGLLKAVIGAVGDDVESGATLSEAMEKHPKAFDRLYSNMVRAGETGGVLDIVLQRLAEFMEKAQKIKRKVIGAMIYPAVVISFAVGIVAFIMVKVVPKFNEIFAEFDTELPKVTKVLIATSDWFAKGKPPGWAIVLVSPLAFFFIFKLLRQSKGGRYFLDRMFMMIPILGPLLRKSAIARFTRTLGTLINAGVPILEALIITRETSPSEVYARALTKVHDSIREGESFADPLRATRVCDSIVVNMIDVGEETGDLDKMLMKIADNYEEEVEVAVAAMVSILEPVMVVILGGLVGFIVVALFAPLVTLIQSVSKGI
ncbi:MAG: putative type II secretion system protein F [Phycisphaerae bacterium]|nr:putative type II secretion system protein F [Phycisphaerae bacterium]